MGLDGILLLAANYSRRVEYVRCKMKAKEKERANPKPKTVTAALEARNVI